MCVETIFDPGFVSGLVDIYNLLIKRGDYREHVPSGQRQAETEYIQKLAIVGAGPGGTGAAG